MRFDRFITLYFFRPLLGSWKWQRRQGIPILMYHAVAPDTDRNVGPYYRTVTTREVFEVHMRCLQKSAYRVLTLSEALSFMGEIENRASDASGTDERTHLQATVLRPIAVVTFDDGFRDFYTTAFPIMEDCGFKATVFLSTAFIGGKFFNGRECLDVNEIRELAKHGVEFGSHTVNHPQLQNLQRSKIEAELVDSKRRIEEIVGLDVKSFSYPFRFPEEDRSFVAELRELLTAAGYSGGVTTSIGLAKNGDDIKFLRRLPVNDCDDTVLFRAKLSGEYDWMHRAQLSYKQLRANWQGPVKLE